MSFQTLSVIFTLAMAGVSSAALVNIASNTLSPPARNILTSTGALLPVGNAIRIGTFPAGAPVITAASTFASIDALFVPLAEDAVDPADGVTAPLAISAVQGAGKYAGTISGVDNGDSRFTAGTALYVFALNADYLNLSQATEWAIFRDTTAWTIPTTGTRTLTTSQIESQAEMLTGTFTASGLQLSPIPEVSSALLLGSLMGLAVFRRRR